MRIRSATLTSRPRLVGYLASFGAAAGYGAGAFLALLVIREQIPPITGTVYSLLFGTIIMAVLFLRPAWIDLAIVPRRAWVVVSMSGLASALGVASLYFALARVPLVVASPISGANPLVAILMTHFFLQRLERVTLRTVLGAAMVVIGVTLVAMGRT